MPYHPDQWNTRYIMTHEVIHSGEKPYSCTYCSKTFRLKSNLKVHERTHTGGKPYSCRMCNKCFSQVGHLKDHELIHFEEKPHSCTYCSKTFRQKSQLTAHERIHTGKNLILVNIALKCSITLVIWRSMNWYILVRNPTHVHIALKDSGRKNN